MAFEVVVKACARFYSVGSELGGQSLVYVGVSAVAVFARWSLF